MSETKLKYIDRRSAEAILKEWKIASNMKSDHRLMYHIKDGEIYVFACCPGYLIGKAGNLINIYKDKLIEIGATSVNIVEVEPALI